MNSHETQASIDAALTFGILWLENCRETCAAKAVVHGLKLFLPAGKASLVRERMAHLHRDAARWELYELNENSDTLTQVDVADRGNIATRLVQRAMRTPPASGSPTPSPRFARSCPRPKLPCSRAREIAFRRHGLEFARARLSQSLHTPTEIVFGIGAEEKILCDQNAERFVRLVRSVGEVRHPEGPRDHPLWRLYPERWLETLVLADVRLIDERLSPGKIYSQVPAFSAADRGMLDVLCTTNEGRLVVLELKADEDIHLPLQGVDYWSRVAWHHERREFRRFGYFPGTRTRSPGAAAVSGCSGSACASRD